MLHSQWKYIQKDAQYVLDLQPLCVAVVWHDESVKSFKQTWRARVIACGVMDFEEVFTTPLQGQEFAQSLVEHQIKTAHEFLFQGPSFKH